jgi:ElaB/YqjD/DUF883 family membrane-anchored ribosome-binding protein
MKRVSYGVALAALLTLAGLATTAQAQRPYRPTHEYLKSLIERIEKNTDAMRTNIDAALDRSRFDGSRSEDNINEFVKEFEQAADRLKDRFSDDNAAAPAVEELLRRGQAIDSFLRRHWLSQRAQRDWRNIYRDLNTLARAYHVGWSWTSPTMYPYRVSNDEMKRLMEWTEKRADSFRASLDEALDKSRFDGTKREDDINQFVRDFEVATDNLRERFNDNYSAVGAASEVLKRGALIDRFMQRHALTTRAQNDWRLLRDNLDEIARAYNVSMNWKNWTINIL